jgi:hypothetical protein
VNEAGAYGLISTGVPTGTITVNHSFPMNIPLAELAIMQSFM